MKCHQYHDVVTANVSSIEGPSSGLIDAGLEFPGYKNKINMVIFFHHPGHAILFFFILYLQIVYLQLLAKRCLQILAVLFRAR